MRVSYHSNCKTQSYIFRWTSFKISIYSLLMSNLPQIVSHSLLPDVQNVCCLLAYLSLSGYSGHPTPPIKLHKWILSLSKSDLCRMFTNSKISFSRKWWFREWIMFWVREQCRSYKVNVFKWGDQCFIIFNFEWIVRSCLSTATQPMSFTL